MSPLVSIIIPCYNSSDTIEISLKSVLLQTYSNIQIIIVDDLSIDTEKTYNACVGIFEKFKFSNYKFHRSKIKLLGGGARNLGVELCDGDIIAFLDSDDLWIENKISNQVAALKNNNSVVFTSLIRGKDFSDGVLMPNEKFNRQCDIIDYIFIHENVIQTSTIMMYKVFFNKFKFDESLRRHQDFDLIIRISKHAEFIHLDKAYVLWYEEDGFSPLKKGVSYMFCEKFILTRIKLLGLKSSSFYIGRTLLSVAIQEREIFKYLMLYIKLSFKHKIMVGFYILKRILSF